MHPNTWLASDQVVAVDVPAKLAARVRMLSTGHGRKTDDADATSVGIAALTAVGLRTAGVDEAITVLRALIEHRDDVIKTRTQTVNLNRTGMSGGSDRWEGWSHVREYVEEVSARVA